MPSTIPLLLLLSTIHGARIRNHFQLDSNLTKTRKPIVGLPYIIRSKYGGGWYDAELSWDGDANPHHPMASVEFDDPVDWTFKESSGFYRIVSTYGCPNGRYCNWELSWDGHSGHAMASVENNDPVDWELRESGDYFRIVNKYPGSYYNYELSWDGQSPHPMASVERNDPVDWEIIPSIESTGCWSPYKPMPSSGGASVEIVATYGTSKTESWTHTSSWEVGAHASAEFGAVTVGGSVTYGESQSWSQAVSTDAGSEFHVNLPKGPNSLYVWQWEVKMKSNHRAHRSSGVKVHTKTFDTTPGRGFPPMCPPGDCEMDTGCQRCQRGIAPRNLQCK